MAVITFGGSDARPSVATEGLRVRSVTYDRTATSKRVVVDIDTREFPEPEDIVLPEEGSWSLVDTVVLDRDEQPVVVAKFLSEREAEACLVGLEYNDPESVKHGRYEITPPGEA